MHFTQVLIFLKPLSTNLDTDHLFNSHGIPCKWQWHWQLEPGRGTADPSHFIEEGG